MEERHNVKNVLVAYTRTGPGSCTPAMLRAYLGAQVENSLEVGWNARDILLVTNFDYECLGVKARQIAVSDPRPTAGKVLAMEQLLRESAAHEELWLHDLDAWQNQWFDCPSFRDLGICQHLPRKPPAFNSGSVFYRAAAQDIVARVARLLTSDTERAEEATMNQVLNESAYRQRLTVLNATYNVGSTNFAARYFRSEMPVRVCHFHPDLREHLALHLWGQNALHARTVGPRLERLLGRYFAMPPAPESRSRGRETARTARE